MRNKFLATALLVILPFFVTACTLRDLPVIGKFFPQGKNTSTFPTGPVTINMWGLWESPDVMQGVIAKYKEKRPNVTVNYDDRSVIKLVDYKETVYTRAGQDGAPDIVMVHDSWMPGLKASLAPAPANVLTAQAYTDRFYAPAVKSAVADGKVYAAPYYYDGLVMVYNKKHFAEIDQQDPPTAWEEFRRIALELTIRGKDGSLVRGGAAIGNANNITFFADILGLMLSQAKVNIPADLDSKPAQDALSFYTNFVTEDRVWNDSFAEAATAFAQEKVSIIFVPSWNLLDIVKARPDLEIGVAPVPQALPDDPVTWGSFWMAAVPNGSKNKEVAWDFVNFLTQDEAQLQMFSENTKARLFGAPYSSKTLKGQLDTNPMLKPFVDTADMANVGITSCRAGNKAAEDAIRDAINTTIQSGNSAAALTTAKSKLANTK
jgi:multiple sugar transport system substrate-binding protein